MPLMNNQGNGHIFIQTTTPNGAISGDLWSDTTTTPPILKIYDGSSWSVVATNSFSTAAVVSQSTTIGDYTTPTNAVIDNGQNTSVNNYQATSGTGWQNNVRVTKFTGLTVGAKITAVQLNVSTAANNVRVKIYQDDGTAGDPSTLLGESGSIAVGGTGIQTFNLATQATVPASGNVYAGFETDGSSLGIKSTTGLASGVQKNVAHAYGAGPSPFGSVTDSTEGFWTGIVLYGSLNLNDTSTSTRSTTAATANPSMYIDMNAAANICAAAFYWDGTNTTETSMKIQTSADALTWTDKRLITTSNLTNGAWNYYRFNIANARYVRFYGNSGASTILSIYEAKALIKTDAQVFADLGILQISATDSTLDPDGT